MIHIAASLPAAIAPRAQRCPRRARHGWSAIYDDAPDTSDFQQTSGKLVAARDLVTAFYRSIICG
ncbi:MAG: hypothetical protein AAFV96_13935, partial [Pseudomonadota bacterium]